MNRLKYIFLSVILSSAYSYAGGRDVTDYVNAFVGFFIEQYEFAVKNYF